MLIERAEFIVREGMESALATVMEQQGLPLLQGVAGVVSLQFGCCVEHPEKSMLLVHWKDMAAHEAYSASPTSNDFRALVGPLLEAGVMEHFELK